MNKIYQVLNLLMLIIIPIIGNLIYLLIFPLYLIQILFSNQEKYYSITETYYNAIAKFKI